MAEISETNYKLQQAKGEIKEGVQILKINQQIVTKNTKERALQRLKKQRKRKRRLRKLKKQRIRMRKTGQVKKKKSKLSTPEIIAKFLSYKESKKKLELMLEEWKNKISQEILFFKKSFITVTRKVFYKQIIFLAEIMNTFYKPTRRNYFLNFTNGLKKKQHHISLGLAGIINTHKGNHTTISDYHEEIMAVVNKVSFYTSFIVKRRITRPLRHLFNMVFHTITINMNSAFNGVKTRNRYQ